VLSVVDLQAAGGAFNAGGLEKSFVERLEAQGMAAVDELADEIEGRDADLELETDVVRTTSFDGVAPPPEFASTSPSTTSISSSWGHTAGRISGGSYWAVSPRPCSERSTSRYWS